LPVPHSHFSSQTIVNLSLGRRETSLYKAPTRAWKIDSPILPLFITLYYAFGYCILSGLGMAHHYHFQQYESKVALIPYWIRGRATGCRYSVTQEFSGWVTVSLQRIGPGSRMVTSGLSPHLSGISFTHRSDLRYSSRKSTADLTRISR